MKTLIVAVGIVALSLALLLGALYFVNPDFYFVLHSERTKISTRSQNEEEPKLLPIVLETKEVTFGDGTGTTFDLASGFNITVAAEDLGKARFMTMSPDGRIFVPDLVDYQLSRAGSVSILEDFNEETREFETKHTYLSGLRGPNSIAFYTNEEGQTWLYLALTAHLVRYLYEAGDTAPSGEPEIIFEFPNTQAPEAKSVVWHITRTILLSEDRFYVSVGSGCNSCEQPEGEKRGMIFSMEPDGSDIRVVATGLRNAVGMALADGELYATENGVDHLGADAPDETMYHIKQGEHYGWPYCYESDGVLKEDTSVDWNDLILCEEVPHSFASFSPRSAPLGITYFEDVHPALRGSFLVALHGSFNPELRSGYQLVRVSEEGEQEVFMKGFQKEDNSRVARPLHVLQKDENSFFLSDDHGGRIYYIYVES